MGPPLNDKNDMRYAKVKHICVVKLFEDSVRLLEGIRDLSNATACAEEGYGEAGSLMLAAK